MAMERITTLVKDGASKSLMLLWQRVASEEAAWCHTSTLRDFETVARRIEDEGLSFLTITLPRFGKDFERSLELRRIDRSLFLGFAWKAGLPKFLSGFLGQIFCVESGIMVDKPSVDAIRAVRQLTLMFGKTKLKCSDAREAAAMKGFVDCEKSVKEMDDQRSHIDYMVFHRVSRLLWANVLAESDRQVFYGEVVPRHGSGATANKLKGNRKFKNRTWTRRLEESFFPAGEHMFSSPSHFWEGYSQVNWLEPDAEMPVNVISVPKTLDKPRIIGIEPSWMQFCQQALQYSLYNEIEKGDARSAIVGLTHQEPNQLLALKGSLSGSLATLDLSEASDRVSNLLVTKLLEDHPHLSAAVSASRSKTANVPGQGVMPLAKFASMGSALCFPIEAMVFATVIFVGIQKALRRPVTQKDIQSMKGKVRVYGDDIVVPVEFVDCVIEALEAYGFKVNLRKSFWNGQFRESCGKEYFDGEDVTIVRVRQLLPTSRKDVPEVVSTVSLRNQLYKAGLWQSAHYLDGIIERVIPFPVVSETSAVLGRISALGYETQRISPSTHAPQVKGYTVKAKIPLNKLDGVDALLKFFLLKRGQSPQHALDYLNPVSMDEEHLERSGRPVSVDINYGWACPF